MRFKASASPILWLLIASVTACSDAAERGPSTAPSGIKANLHTVCLDRFLIDLPATSQVGASMTVYRGPYNLPGLAEVGALGVRWSGVIVDETHSVKPPMYEEIQKAAHGELAESLFGDRSTISGADRRLKRRYSNLEKATTPEEKASIQEHISDDKIARTNGEHSLKVSGKASIADKNAFAFRKNDTYSIGYLDPVDQRVRMFEGKLPDPQHGSPEAAAQMYRHFQRVYHRRAPTDIPTAPGYCTGHGFLDEPADKPETETSLNLPFRSLKYPNLVFILTVKPADPNGPRDIEQLDNPNVITREDIKGMKGMGAIGALAGMANVRKTYGPKPANLAGQNGRILGREYRHSGHMNADTGVAYEIEAEVLGEPGRIDRPAIKLQLAAALPDAHPLPVGETALRPSIKGLQPPPFSEALKVFEDVLKSVRLRPVTSPQDSKPSQTR